MGDFKKGQLSNAKSVAAKAAAVLLHPLPVKLAGLPAGVVVNTNAKAVARFPLPLSIGSAVLASVGIIARMRGYRIIGTLMVGAGIVGLGAAAAAPELSAALTKAQTPGVGSLV